MSRTSFFSVRTPRLFPRLRFSLSIVLLIGQGALAQSVELPVQGFLSDAGAAVQDEVTLEFKLVNESGQDLTCEQIVLTPDAGFFTARLGTAGGTACGGLGTTLDALLFRDPLSLEVAEAGQAPFGLFPIGDVPTAAVARVAERRASDHPRVISAPDTQAFLDALTAAAANGPTIIELGPATYSLGAPITIPEGTTVKGRGRLATTITGRVTLEGDTRLAALTISDNLPDGTVVTVAPGPADRVELADVHIVGAVATAGSTGLGVVSGDGSTTVDLDNVAIDVTAINAGIGIFDAAGVTLDGHRVRIDVGTESAIVTIGVRVGLPGTEVTQGALLLDDLVLDLITLGGFAAGVETNAEDPSSSDAGRVRLNNARITVLADGGRGVASQGSKFEVLNSKIIADHPLFRLPDVGLRQSTLDVVGTGLDPQVTPSVEAGSASPVCRNVYRTTDLSAVAADCNIN